MSVSADDPQEPFKPFRLGRFNIMAPLGTGGMARVFLAEYTGVGGFARRVVVKQILEQHAANDRFVRMFVDEANIASNLMHPNVVGVLDLQQEGHNLYMVLEFVDGLDLNTLFNAMVADGQNLPVDVALFVMKEVLSGLMHAHAALAPDGSPLNLIHRDITPGNVLLGRQGQVKLSDFGVARAVGRMTQTVVGEVKGKYSYMAPEVMQGDAYDQRSDVFGAGVVLWEALTTRPLFRGKSDFHVMEAVLRGPLYAPSGFNPEVPGGLDAVVMQALERNVDKRFQSARAFKKALSPFLANLDQDAAQERLVDLVMRHAPPAPTRQAGPLVTPGPMPAVAVTAAPGPSPAPAAPAAPAPAPRQVPAPLPTPAPLNARQPTPPAASAAPPAAGPAPGAPRRTSSPQFPMEPLVPSPLEMPPAPASPGVPAWMTPPSPGDPGFYAMVGPDRTPFGPMATRALVALLQRQDSLVTDKVGIAPSAMIPIGEAGRLLLLDHLAKPPQATGPATIQGVVRDAGAMKLMHTLASQRASGMLQLQAPAGSMQVFLHEGGLHYAFLGDPTHHLLSLFVTHQPNGLALLPQILAHVLRERMSLPRAMAKVAQLPGTRINAAVAVLSRERLIHGLNWEGVSYSFHPGLNPPYELSPPKDTLLATLPAALARWLTHMELSRQAQRLMDRPLELDTRPQLVGELGLGRETEALRGALVASPTLRGSWPRLCAPGSPDEQRMLVAVLVLQQCGVLRERAA